MLLALCVPTGSAISAAPEIRHRAVAGRWVPLESGHGSGEPVSRLQRRTPLVRQAAVPVSTPVQPTVSTPVLTPVPQAPPAPGTALDTSFVVASFNVLGSNHTRPGSGSGYADGVTRARWAAEVIVGRGFDVIGLQEVQVDQLGVLMAATGGAFASYPPLGNTGSGVPQALIWRVDTWEVTAATTFMIPFVGERRPQPVVLLRNRLSGREVWFVNVHLSPRRARRDGEGERNVATAALIAQVRELQTTGIPVVVTGDMNEHGEIYCNLAMSTGLTSASGGSVAGGCRPPRSRVDWIFGSPIVNWSGFAYHSDPAVRRITDHAIAVAQVSVPGA